MSTLIVKERYKVIRVLKLKEHFSALQAVDITTRSNEQYILNVYDGDLIKPYVTYLSSVDKSPEFVEMFIREDSLVAVFKYSDGLDMDTFFKKGNSLTDDERLMYADRLYDLALSICDYSPYVSCPLMLSSQLRPLPADKKIGLRYIIEPMEGMNERELALLLRDQLIKILDVRFDTAWAVRRYLFELRHKDCRSVTQMCSEWRLQRAAMVEETKGIAGQVVITRWIGLLWINVKDFYYNNFKNR